MQKTLRRGLRLRTILFISIFLSGMLVGNIDKAGADIVDLEIELIIRTAPPSCTIGDGGYVLISFDDVHEALIDGVSYKRIPINYNLVCRELESNYIGIRMLWSELIFDGESVVKTSRRNFGIALYSSLERLKNGHLSTFYYNQEHPRFYAVPIKPKGMNLVDGGSFNASMTVEIIYM